MRHILKNTLLLGLTLGLAAPALARGDNTNYGETRFNALPLSGVISKTIWVGSWWAYSRDGSAYRLHDPSVSGAGNGYATRWDRFESREASHLSPAEKYDTFVGRADKIEYEALIARGQKVAELNADMKARIDERRGLVTKLNRVIGENRTNPQFKWWETEDGQRYQALQKEIEDFQEQVDAVELTVDTATEFEVLTHGSVQFGVDSWFGHCNAWAAAAIIEPEPRRSVTVDGITFTGGDVKALITEGWMEIQSSFWATRNNAHDTDEDRADVSFRDMTPAGFHILFADQIGLRDKSFVIDRYTGSQVWNQPVKAYRAKCEPLYEGDAGLERAVAYTSYGANGAKVEDRGTREVYPVLCTTTIHWVTDGLAHETLTVDHDSRHIDDTTFANHSRINQLFDRQIEMRTLTYELWLDKPMTDERARIVGDGAWEHGAASGYEHLHPDFAWQPTGNVNSSARDYENEFFDYRVVVEQLLPGSLEPKDDPDVEPATLTATGAVAIPDKDTSAGARLELAVAAAVQIHTLTVDVDITHTYIGDLQVELHHPDGRVAILKPYGEGRSDHDVKRSFDVKEFNGASTEGTWALHVYDQWAADVGTINAFTLHFK